MPRDRGLVHVEDLRPYFLGDVIAGVPAGDDDRLAHGEFPWAPDSFIPWLAKQVSDHLLQFIELYGTLEDESPFQTVRRLAEYEDHGLHLVREAGVRTARPCGIVEITPEREYLLVTEFFKDAVEIGQAQVDDAIIDQGLAMIRKLWHAGIAHRDIKPGNLMVRCGELLLIDVCFAQVRPSPWRQAVDLGNMMLVLALRSDPQRV